MASSIIMFIGGFVGGVMIGFQLAQTFNITRKSDTNTQKSIRESEVK